MREVGAVLGDGAPDTGLLALVHHLVPPTMNVGADRGSTSPVSVIPWVPKCQSPLLYSPTTADKQASMSRRSAAHRVPRVRAAERLWRSRVRASLTAEAINGPLYEKIWVGSVANLARVPMPISI